MKIKNKNTIRDFKPSYRYYEILIHPSPGGYYVTIPSIPSYVTQGCTIEECIVMAREIIDMAYSGNRRKQAARAAAKSKVSKIYLPIAVEKRGR